VSRHGRHEFTGRHEAGYRPAEEPWARSSRREVWRAYRGGLVLAVTHLVGGGWEAEVEGPGVRDRSGVLATRMAAQRWADGKAGERRRDS
jgi:hypothetical protein